MTNGGIEKLITPNDYNLLNDITINTCAKEDWDEIKVINVFLRYSQHSFSQHEIAWMISYAKKVRNQFEKKGERNE